MSIPDLQNATAAMLQFLKTELDLGMTFAQIAGTKVSREKQQWNVAQARKAYDTVLRMMGRAPMSAGEASLLQSRLTVLKAALEQLGERC